ncbi:MAG: DNA-directed RNA polymerase subunit omega [Verrucomicrobia bacterium]|nr:DNA-directed RNA polymerase subunit omega [Verrucomicrobiota bacterium]
MNSELAKRALDKVGNPNILINYISRRVRQLNSGSRPLMAETAGLGLADIALIELLEEKMAFEMIEPAPAAAAPAKKRKKH